MAKKTNPVNFLTPAQAFNIAMRLYRQDIKLYLPLIWQSFIWLFVPLYGWAKISEIKSTISRYSFQKLIDEPETLAISNQFVKKRLFQIILLNTLVLIFMWLLAIWGFYYLHLISISIASAFLSLGGFIFARLITIILGLFLLRELNYWWMRVFLSQSSLAIESKINSAEKALKKSFILSKNCRQTLLPIISYTSLNLFPIYFLIYLTTFLIVGVWRLPFLANNFQADLSGVFYFILITTFFVLRTTLMPLEQIVKSVIYYQQKVCLEGYGLKLRHNPPHTRTGTVWETVQNAGRLIIQTPESVELQFTLALVETRIKALLLDILIQYFLSIFIFSFFGFLFQEISNFLKSTFAQEQIDLWLRAIYILLNFLLYMGYFAIFETLWQGQTPGKRMSNIRVICEDGRRISFSQAALRALLLPFDQLLGIGVFSMILTKRKKRLGDLIAGTLIISEETRKNSPNLAISQLAKNLAKKLPEIAHLSNLTPNDLNVIQEYLKRRNVMETEAKAQLSRQLAAQVKTIISLDKIPDKVSAEQFLEAVYLAYQQQ
ncbi:MAG TPA: RDD family protein [Halomicronema sp.]